MSKHLRRMVAFAIVGAFALGVALALTVDHSTARPVACRYAGPLGTIVNNPCETASRPSARVTTWNPVAAVELALYDARPATVRQLELQAQGKAASYVRYWRTSWHPYLNNVAAAAGMCAANDACWAAFDALSPHPGE